MADKVLLINPKIGWLESPAYDRVWPPLSLAYCASILEKNGFKVKIIDDNAENLSKKRIIKRSKKFDKIFITTSPIDKWQCPEPFIQPTLEFINNLKEANPNIYVIGAHGTMKPKEILELTNAKAIIRGEPESVILDICSKDLKKIKGITYKENKKIISNPDRNLIDLNKLPLPAFHLLPMKKYFYEILGNDFTLFEGSRGCPFSCIFCIKSMYGSKCRIKSSDKLIEEVVYGIESFGVKTAYFIDLEFCLNEELVNKLCDFLIKEKYDFNWTCQTRFDTINLNLLKKMKKSGCELIHFGVESGSPRILNFTNKKITIDQIKSKIKLLKKLNIKTVCFFMFGLPNETEKDMKMTIKLANELNPTYSSFHTAVPYPGTVFYNMIKNEVNDNELFPSFYGNKEKLEKIRNEAYRSFYLRPSYILSRLKQGELKLLKKQVSVFLRCLK
jgi:radical SAM superfamily enzyme YgiQ (UPF0313 family)